MNNLIEKLISFFSGLPNEVVILILSILPISELRGAIPVGIFAYKLDILKTTILAITGNFSFVIPFLLFLNYFHKYFMKLPIYNKLFNWWYSKVISKTKNIEKYEYLGLLIFVGIPLPMTGAWSGCLASYLLRLNLWKSAVYIFLGIVLACIIVLFSTLGGREIFKYIF
ncbi:MAG: small multi-drug export protein [Endomicrobia bacterium]|nr:small multi-drug export protein [Endomicrobiia bacterium]